MNKRTLSIAPLIPVCLALAGCSLTGPANGTWPLFGEEQVYAAPGADTTASREPTEVAVEPVGDSSVSGSATFARNEYGVLEVELALDGLPVAPPGATDEEKSYRGAIFAGGCAEAPSLRTEEEDADEAEPLSDAPEAILTLNAILAGEESYNSRVTTVSEPVVDEVLTSEPRYLDVRAPDGSAVACGDLPAATAE